MTLPVPGFSDGVGLTAAMLNNLSNGINAGSWGYGGSTTDPNTTVTFASTATDYAGGGVLTISGLTTQRRYLILVMARFVPTSSSPANGRYVIQVGFNTGASVNIGSVSKTGTAWNTWLTPGTLGGATNASSGIAFGTVLCSPNTTYQVYGAVQRANGGTATDTATNFQTLWLDIGST